MDSNQVLKLHAVGSMLEFKWISGGIDELNVLNCFKLVFNNKTIDINTIIKL